MTTKKKRKSKCYHKIAWISDGDKRAQCLRCKKYFVIIDGEIKETL